jgi:ATP-binding cassette subfamily B protein
VNPAELLRPHRLPIAGLLGFSLGISALGLAQPWLTKLLIDDGLLARDYPQVLLWTGLLFLAALTGSLAGGLNRWLYTRLSGRILFAFREQVYAHLQRLSPAFFTRNRSGDILARLDGDVAEIQRFALDSLFAGISGVFGLIGTVALMLLLNPMLTLLALAVIPLEWLWLRAMRLRVRERAMALRARASDVSAFLVETLPAMKFIQSVAATDREAARLGGLNRAYLEGLLRLQLTEFATAAVPANLGALARAGVFAAGGWEVVQGRMGLGALLAFASYLGMAMGPVQSLLGVYMGFNRVRVSLERVRHLTEALPEVEDTGMLEPPSRPVEIRLDGVSFGHATGEWQLQEATLTIAAGTRIGLFGPSGAGKSTLVDLLLRHHEPTSGRILIDGRDLRDYRLAAWRRRVALVSQDIVLFRGSLLENLRYARPEASEESVREALHRAQLGEFLAQQAEGLHAVIGERGTRLSGGERQRLAIARAILQEPILLVFDEATSSLDADTEHELLLAIDALFPGVTRLMISHRERPLADAGLLLELREGRLLPRSV